MSTSIPLPRLGIDLLSDETQMPAGTVRAAVNVDIDKRGQFARRRGSALTTPGRVCRDGIAPGSSAAWLSKTRSASARSR